MSRTTAISLGPKKFRSTGAPVYTQGSSPLKPKTETPRKDCIPTSPPHDSESECLLRTKTQNQQESLTCLCQSQGYSDGRQGPGSSSSGYHGLRRRRLSGIAGMQVKKVLFRVLWEGLQAHSKHSAIPVPIHNATCGRTAEPSLLRSHTCRHGTEKKRWLCRATQFPHNGKSSSII